MYKRGCKALCLMLSFILLAMLAKMGWTEEVPRITKEELKSMLGNPDVVILDVRLKKDQDESKWRIPGALREDPQKDVKSWAGKYSQDKTIVLYCA